MDKLIHEGRFEEKGQSVLILSTRNVLSNLRCLGYVKGQSKAPLAVAGEILNSVPRITFLARNRKPITSAYGTRTILKIKRSMNLTGSYPVSQCYGMRRHRISCLKGWFRRPRTIRMSGHPAGTIPQRLKRHCANGRVCTISLNQPWAVLGQVAFAKASGICTERGSPKRARIFSTMSLELMEKLLQMITIGQLEAIGQRLRQMGAKRALCLDNSGSCVVRYLPVSETGISAPFVQMAAAPYHRPLGTAYIASNSAPLDLCLPIQRDHLVLNLQQPIISCAA